MIILCAVLDTGGSSEPSVTFVQRPGYQVREKDADVSACSVLKTLRFIF